MARFRREKNGIQQTPALVIAQRGPAVNSPIVQLRGSRCQPPISEPPGLPGSVSEPMRLPGAVMRATAQPRPPGALPTYLPPRGPSGFIEQLSRPLSLSDICVMAAPSPQRAVSKTNAEMRPFLLAQGSADRVRAARGPWLHLSYRPLLSVFHFCLVSQGHPADPRPAPSCQATARVSGGAPHATPCPLRNPELCGGHTSPVNSHLFQFGLDCSLFWEFRTSGQEGF